MSASSQNDSIIQVENLCDLLEQNTISTTAVIKNYNIIISKKIPPKTTYYANLEKLTNVCNSFIGQKIHLTATINNKSIPIKNPNLVGDLLEDIFYPFYKDACP